MHRVTAYISPRVLTQELPGTAKGSRVHPEQRLSGFFCEGNMVTIVTAQKHWGLGGKGVWLLLGVLTGVKGREAVPFSCGTQCSCEVFLFNHSPVQTLLFLRLCRDGQQAY